MSTFLEYFHSTKFSVDFYVVK